MMMRRGSGWFIDLEGNARFRITDLVQPRHPLILKLAEGKTPKQIYEYIVNNVRYDDEPPFRFYLIHPEAPEAVVLIAPKGFKPSDLVEYVVNNRRGNCVGKSILVCSLLQSIGVESYVSLGNIRKAVREELES